MAKKMVRYLALMKLVDGKRIICFPDFKGNLVAVDSPEAAVFTGLKLLKKEIDFWLKTHDYLPKPKTTIDMTNFESCVWYPAAVDEAKIPREDSENCTDEKIFTLEEIEKDLGLDIN